MTTAQKILHQDAQRLVHGLRVAVVGNAKSIFDYEEGDAIDAADVVIRFNVGLSDVKNPDHVRSLGKRTTIMAGNYFSRMAWKDADHPLIFYVKTRRCDDEMPHQRWLPGDGGARVREYVIGEDQALLSLVKRPSCGVHLVNHLMKELYPSVIRLYGFDFFETPTWYWSNIATSPHDGISERDWFLSQGFKSTHSVVWEWTIPTPALRSEES